jgi:RecA-family ATPase
MDSAPLRELIRGILPELGMTSIAGLSNHGKTLFAIEMVKALLSGKPLLGHFEVLQPTQVLYLCPEVSERSFRYRLGKFGLGDCGEELLCQTLSDGQAANLRSPSILRAARERVVFLDTAIRFSDGDENNSRDNNKGLAESCFNLLRAGAKAVVCLHHSAKGFFTGRTSNDLRKHTPWQRGLWRYGNDELRHRPDECRHDPSSHRMCQAPGYRHSSDEAIRD